MANELNQPKEFSWAGLAATTGAAGLGGFIFDRYIRGNKNLTQNLIAAAGFGAVGAAASAAHQYLSEKNRTESNNKNPDNQIDRAGNKVQPDEPGPASTVFKNVSETIQENPVKSALIEWGLQALNAKPVLKRAVKFGEKAAKRMMSSQAKAIKTLETMTTKAAQQTPIVQASPEAVQAAEKAVTTATESALKASQKMADLQANTGGNGVKKLWNSIQQLLAKANVKRTEHALRVAKKTQDTLNTPTRTNIVIVEELKDLMRRGNIDPRKVEEFLRTAKDPKDIEALLKSSQYGAVRRYGKMLVPGFKTVAQSLPALARTAGIGFTAEALKRGTFGRWAAKLEQSK